MLPHKILTEHFDHITYLPEFVHYFIGIAGSLCRVGKILVKAFGRGKEVWTVFLRIVTNGDDIVEGDIQVLVHIIRGMTRYIDMVLSHYLYCFGVYTMRFYTGAVNFGLIACKIS